MKLFCVTIFFCLLALSGGCQLIVADMDSRTPAPVATGTTAIITPTVALTATMGVTDTLTPVITDTIALTTPAVITQVGSTDLAAQGMAIYQKQYCGICHQLTATGAGGTFGPSHDGVGTLAAQRLQDPNYHGTATTAAEYLHESLVDPQIYVVPGYELTSHRMPIYNFLPEADVAALVEFLLQQE